jgi:Aspartyl/Asparaginyl beta-hydroxylase
VPVRERFMRIESLVRGISRADLGAPAIQCLRLFRLKDDLFRELRGECLRLCGDNQPSDAAGKRHVTNWAGPYGKVRQYSLLNVSGRFDDFSTDHNQSCLGKQFHHARDYPALAHFVCAFPHCINFRLNVLGCASGLRAHKEHVCLFGKSRAVGLRVRFHLPVCTNPGANVVLGETVYHFEEGVVYFFNQGCVHGARNGGTEDRLHLVWDMLLTREASELMFGEDLPEIRAERFVGTNREVEICGREPIGQFEQISPLVPPDEVWSAGLISPQ